MSVSWRAREGLGRLTKDQYSLQSQRPQQQSGFRVTPWRKEGGALTAWARQGSELLGCGDEGVAERHRVATCGEAASWERDNWGRKRG